MLHMDIFVGRREDLPAVVEFELHVAHYARGLGKLNYDRITV